MIPLLKYWQLILGAVGCLILGVMLWSANNRADRYEKLYTAEQKAHQGTVTNYRLAQAKAVQEDAANKARVEAEQRAITERVSKDYEKRIADVRARYAGIVRTGKAPSNPGGSGGPSVSGPGSTPGGIDDPAAQGGLPASDALIATEQAIQLEALQAWVKEQTRVKN